jgi:hypothetical protein
MSLFHSVKSLRLRGWDDSTRRRLRGCWWRAYALSGSFLAKVAGTQSGRGLAKRWLAQLVAINDAYDLRRTV